MTVHILLLSIVILIITAAVGVLHRPAREPSCTLRKVLPSRVLNAGSRVVCGADKPHMVPLLKAIRGEKLCEIYGLAVFTKKPHFCWMTNATKGLRWCSEVLKWGCSWGSSARDSSQGQLLREQVGTARVLGIVMWKSKAFSGWFQWEKENILR